jgi:DNA-binding beta-propeller fold protein YncE
MNAQAVGQGRFRYRVDPTWDRYPAAGPDGEAVAVACASDARVFVFLRGPNPVQVFQRDGTALGSWGAGVFVRPHGICIGPDDTVYCTGDFDHAVRAFSPEGKLRFTLGIPGRPSETGATSIDYRTIRQAGPPFNYPTNLAVAPSGDLYVADGYGNARVHRFAPDGTLRQSWGAPGSGPGEFYVPHGIAVAPDGTVFVADRENSRLQLFSPDGVYQTEWTDVARPCQVFVDRAGDVFVAELGFRAGRWPGTGAAPAGATGGRVSIFDRSGVLQSRWGGGEDPCAPGDFCAPHGLWVDAHGDLYVGEVTLAGGVKAGLVPGSCHSFQKFIRC